MRGSVGLTSSRGKSIKAICRELRVSRKTVRKVIQSEETDFHYEREQQPMPRLGEWREKLDALLTSNEGKSSRERLTLIRVFETLRGLGYEGGYDAVRRYARSSGRLSASPIGCSQRRCSAEAYSLVGLIPPSG